MNRAKTYRRKVNSFGEAAAVGGAVLFLFAAAVAAAFAFTVGFTALFVALAWNWLGVHEVFNAEPLSFWHVIGVAVVINILRSIFSRSS